MAGRRDLEEAKREFSRLRAEIPASVMLFPQVRRAIDLVTRLIRIAEAERGRDAEAGQ